MKYFLQLNGDSGLQCPAEHVSKISDTQIQVDDFGSFPFLEKPVVVETIELIGEDGQIYAMRKLRMDDIPPITIQPNCVLSLQFRLTISKDNGISWDDPQKS